MSADPVIAYDRSTLVDIVVYHWRTDKSGCGCGWAELGKSYPHHIADVYEASLRARSETSSVREDTEFMREIHDAAYEDGRSTGFRQGLAEAAKASRRPQVSTG